MSQARPFRLGIAAAVAVAGAAAVILLAHINTANGGPEPSAKRWTTLSASPLMRTEVGAARVGRFVYVVGGLLEDRTTTNQVARYDMDRGTWSLVSPMPTAVHHPAVASLGGALYVYGGYTNSSFTAETDALQRYDPATGSWQTLTGSGTQRAAATLAAVGGSLYAVGGAAGGQALNTVQVYDVASGAWRPGPPIGVPREHLASAVIGRRIFVLGGRASGANLNTVEVLTTGGGGWAQAPPIPVARSGFQAASVERRVVVAGGEELTPGGETIQPVELFDPVKRRWHALPGMKTPRHGLGVVARGRLVLALEGGPHPGFAFSNALEALLVPRRLLGR